MSPQEPTYRRRQDSRWEGRIVTGYDEAGHRIRKSVYGDTLAEAKEKMAAFRQSIPRSAAYSPPNDQTIRTLAGLWITSAGVSISEKTLERYNRDLTYLLPLLGDMPLARLREFHVAEMYQRGKDAGLSDHQRFRAGRALRQVLKYGCRLGYLPNNIKVSLPRYQAADMRPLLPEQVPIFLKAAEGGRNYALFVLAIDSGARQGELFALTWADWFPDTHEISITKSVSENDKGELTLKEPKTKAARRRIIVSEKTKAALMEHRRDRPDDTLMFPDHTGGWYRRSNFTRNHFKPILKKTGLSIRFHDLRHTTATLLLAAGDNLKSISDRLGHANTDMVLRTYGHVIPQMRRESARLMDGLLG